MIEPGSGWRFREHLLDLPLLQDQVVEHVLTGHLAMRRVYSDEVCRDARALEEIQEQVAHVAAVRHRGMSRFAIAEKIATRLAVTAEYVQGTSLKTLTLAGNFKAPARWAAHARLVTRLLRSLSREGLGIDRVRLSQLVFAGSVLRVSSWQPVSPHGLETDGVVLKALRQVPTGGVYYRGETQPRPTEWKQLMTILYCMASAQVDRDIAAAKEFYSKQEHSHSALGIEAPIEALLLRFRDEMNPEAAWHWDDLLSGIELLIRGHEKAPAAPRAVSVSMAPANSSSSRQKSSEPISESESQRFTLQAPVKPPPEVVVSLPVAMSPQEVAEREARMLAASPSTSPSASSSATGVREQPAGETPAPRRSREEVYTRDELKMTGREGINDDAEEDRTYLYPPSSSSTEAVKKSGTVAVAKRRRLQKRWFFVAIGIAGMAALAVMGFMWAQSLLASRQRGNLPPVAAIAPVEGSHRAYDRIPLDGTPSTDPEGQALRYNWSVQGLRSGEEYLFEPNNSTRAGRTELRIYASGTYTVQLEVFDLAFKSEPVTAPLVVGEPLVRQR